MSTNSKIEANHVMVAGGVCYDASVLADNKDKHAASEGNSSSEVTILVTMPMELKRKIHAEAKRRQQTLSEYICAKCDFLEVDA